MNNRYNNNARKYGRATDNKKTYIIPNWLLYAAPYLQTYWLVNSRLWTSIMNTGILDKEIDLLYTTNLYFVGGAEEGYSAFPYISYNGSCRTVKFKRYGMDGHPDDSPTKRLDYDLKKKGELPQCWEFTPCPFGENQLKDFPNDIVCVVPDEATAITAKLCKPKFTWLAIGRYLRRDLFTHMQGRTVMLLPDANLYEDWAHYSQFIRGCKSLTVVNWCRNEPQDSRRTIADLLIENALPSLVNKDGLEDMTVRGTLGDCGLGKWFK